MINIVPPPERKLNDDLQLKAQIRSPISMQLLAVFNYDCIRRMYLNNSLINNSHNSRYYIMRCNNLITSL